MNGRELWELAKYFDATDDIIRKALCWYQNGNLALEYCGFLRVFCPYTIIITNQKPTFRIFYGFSYLFAHNRN